MRAFRRLKPHIAVSSARLASHRPYLRRDAERLRCVRDGSFVRATTNPGIRIEPEFVCERSAAELVQEARRVAEQYGYAYDGDTRAHVLGADGNVEHTAELVNNVRVTGRPEKPGEQRLPPWGYGDDMVEDALPPAIARLVARVRGCGAFSVGALRDVTMNLRAHSYFQLDPHLDPEADGPDVFVLSLLSSAVTTFTPTAEACISLGVERRSSPHEIGLASWTDADVDALVQPRTLLHFHGDARYEWSHAIRAGVQVPSSGGEMICDWWGQSDYLISRSAERISIVLAFATPEGQ
eukprot:CAMPEP_0183358032 /NCGR_PEP_ID=MMETSP0164_2-20130417/48008_1 /TAXON_ID=221442 /ORGANISM="Coccolithus pelagicus ssp braarudi, Strain PLY182g" /LENGTH=294 /DNA_ID=CAMNT_0025531825 /DNA_START=1 /DNA_END=885 /DNA_ORIENTATION=+